MRYPLQRNDDNWVEILLLMYQHKIVTNPEIDSGMLDAKEMSLLTGSANKFYSEIEPKFEEDIDDSLQYLIETGLVEVNNNTGVKVYGLTQEGLQLAHQIKAERQRRLTNIFLSGGILLVSILALAF
ncbi:MULTISPECIES: hypothetical protein [Halobellus]|uniref:hypothetical protein n=1 Tax=Halobellus TaxID=1073986 RepID=UPI002113AF4D|nr:MULTISPECIES: hypothetical protein [Halobellus]MDQ2055506.1 hypothetical protein [Halobellus sp. H-GB7]